MAKRMSLKLDTPNAVRKALARIANMVLNDLLDPRAANSIVAAANVILAGIRVDEQGKKLDELEKLVIEKDR